MAKETILIVDDEVSFTELFSMMLEMEGYQVRVVHNVESALEVLERRRPELIKNELVQAVRKLLAG